MMFGHKHTPIGIDIGETGLKLVQFRRTRDGLELLAATTLEGRLPSNGHSPADQAAFVKDLRQLLLKRKFGCRRAVITLPASEIDIRPLTLPTGSHDVAKMVRWEAESYLDYPIDDAVIDHIVLGEAKSVGERRLEVLATSAEKAKVLRSLELLSRAGLVTEAVDIAPLALSRLLLRSRSNRDGAAAVVDIGARSTHAVVIDEQELRMSRTIEIGGDTLTQAISAALEVSRDEAEALKWQHGAGAPADAALGAPAASSDAPMSEEYRKITHILYDILRDKLELMGRELSKLFRYFSAQNQGRRIEKVLLVGGGGSLKHLDTLLAGQLGTEVEAGAPIGRITGRKVELRGGNERAFAVAAGLALREA